MSQCGFQRTDRSLNHACPIHDPYISLLFFSSSTHIISLFLTEIRIVSVFTVERMEALVSELVSFD